MHSKRKIAKFYPEMTFRNVSFLYGIGVSKKKKTSWRYKNEETLKHQIAKDAKLWSHLKDFNMSKFIEDTYYNFIVTKCLLNHLDCKKSWKLKLTHFGMCLNLDPYDAKTLHKSESLSLLPSRIYRRVWNKLVKYFQTFLCSP